MKNVLKKQAKELAVKAVKFAAKKLLLLLAPYLPVIFIFSMAVILAILLIASIYSAMAPQDALTGIEKSPEDAAIIKDYNSLCDKYNTKDTWLVSDKSVRPEDGDKYESTPEKPYYIGTGKTTIGGMKDRYRHDFELSLKWYVVHSVAVYWAYTQGKDDIPHQKRDEFANDLHPYFYYKESQVISTDKDGTTETHNVYLLVEAYTIYGHYQYHYQWITETFKDGGSVTYEKFHNVQQILPNKWQRLNDYLKVAYNLKANDDTELNRTAVMEASEGFNNQKERLEWLINNVGISNFASTAMIPPELIPFFKEAEGKYGIPWWFLAAVAFKESSFNPQNENPNTHCYGLMQFSPKNWQHYSKLLGFDTEKDRDDPRAQILCGAYMLKELGLKSVNWQGDWKTATLNVLTYYGGFRGEDAEERCKSEYAEPIWQYAEQFKDSAVVWPVPGYTYISSYFGWRDSTNSMHYGIDIPAPTGTPVLSVSGGEVTAVSYDDLSGNYICIDDGIHKYSYCHLSETLVSRNEKVQLGQQIGEVGYTGHCKPSGPDGAHLHFGIKDIKGDHWIDPLLVLNN